MSKFTEENRGAKSGQTVVKKGASKFSEENRRPKDEPKPPQRTFLDDAGKFGMDFMRNFNDTITFGMYPQFLEATGLDPNAKADLEASDPFAAVFGDMAGYVVPGMGASAAVAKAVPKLAGNTIPRIVGREAIANAAVTGVDDVVRGEFDMVDTPIDMAISGGAGGILSGGLAAAGRGISSGARVRGMGGDLTPGDLEAAKGFSDYSRSKGITLNNAEAIDAVAPTRSQRVIQGLERVAQAPAGNARLASFNAARGPQIAEAGKQIVADMGGGIPPSQASGAAKDAIARNKSLVQQSAEPYYKAAEPRRLPPSWVPRDGYTGEAAKEVLDDPGMMKGLTLSTATPQAPKGTVPPTNSVLFLDAVKKKLDTRAARAFAGDDPTVGNFARDEANALTAKLDQIAPTYPVARDIAEQGKGMVDALEAGPLGSVAKSPTTQGQGRALFGATNDVEKEAASIAARNLGRRFNAAGGSEQTGVPVGILANVVDTATSKSPMGWGKTALPTDTAKQLADEALQQAGKEDISPVLAAARAVNPKLTNATSNDHTGMWGEIYSSIRDIGADGVADKMIDPRWIERIGKMGPVQKAATRTASSGVQASAQNRRKSRPKKKKPIEITVRGGNS
jgi:hypothetical protein